MKSFELKHSVFPNTVSVFTEADPPSWLISKENLWFYEQHVLSLGIGESADTDFNKITRRADKKV